MAGVFATLFILGPALVAFYLVTVIPWIGAIVYRLGRGSIQLFVDKEDPRPNLSHVYLFSALWPGVVAVTSLTPPLRWSLIVAIGVVIGLVLTAVAVRDVRAWNRAGLLALLALTSFYGVGLAASLNQDMDSGTPQIHTAHVLAKRTGRHRHRHYYYLKLAPWGPQTSSGEAKVNEYFYRNVSVGGTVCIDLYPGALAIPWYHAKDCRPSTFR